MAKLDERSLAHLFIWMLVQFPYTEDPTYDTDEIADSVTPCESAGHLRDSIVTALVRKGSYQAVAEIERILTLYPDLEWIRWKLIEARTHARLNTWTPLSPQELLAFVSVRNARLIQNGTQLLKILLEELERMQTELHAETPTVFRLWNERPHYTPKSEDRFSDEVKQYLQRRLAGSGVVVNREVVIRPTVKPVFQGQRTDIKVEAVRRDQDSKEGDTITAIIEVKGCWNEDLLADFKGKLHDRYLRDNTCQHGLYLIGWFMCSAWDPSDYRKKGVPKMSLANARQHFSSEARRLSTGGFTLESYVMDTSLPEDFRTGADLAQN